MVYASLGGTASIPHLSWWNIDDFSKVPDANRCCVRFVAADCEATFDGTRLTFTTQYDLDVPPCDGHRMRANASFTVSNGRLDGAMEVRADFSGSGSTITDAAAMTHAFDPARP